MSVASKVGTVGATATGAVIGSFIVPGVGTAIGASIGAGLDWWRYRKAHRHLKKGDRVPGRGRLVLVPVGGRMVAVSHGAPAVSPAALKKLSPAAAHPLAAVHMAAVVAAAPPTTPPATLQAVATAAPATAPPEATALYAYFQKYPYDRMLGGTFWRSAHTNYLVTAFQSAFNSAPESATLGPLKATGLYDGKTAAALTLYTHDPVAADPSAGAG